MKMSKYAFAAQKIGFRGPLIDSFSFVGRKKELRKMDSSLNGAQVTSIWIWSPRRIGKSSLSYRIALRKQIRFCCDQYEWNGLDQFASVIADEAKCQLGIGLEQSGRNVIKEIAKKGKDSDPVVLILDEFDKVAINLQQNEQAFLRAVLQEHPHFGIVFITRTRPEDLLQDYSDESSRLLGVCDIMRVPLLTTEDIGELINLIEKACEEKMPEWFLSWIYERVGGHPICVQAIIRDSLLLADEAGRFPSIEAFECNADCFIEQLESYLKGLWKDLGYPLRSILLDSSIVPTEKIKRELKTYNLLAGDRPLHPKWLIEIGKASGLLIEDTTISTFIGLTEKLIELVRICNDISLYNGGHQVFEISQEFLHLFEVARPVDSELDLRDRVVKLAKICVESTDSAKLPKEDKCLIPKEIRNAYKKTEGFEILWGMRNFFVHDPSHGLESHKLSKRFTNIGQIYARYLGEGRYKVNDKVELNKIYQGILEDIIESLQSLQKALEELYKS